MSGPGAASPQTVDEYIADADPEIRERMVELRDRIRLAAPDAVESISYGMPTYRLTNGQPVYFACWKHFERMFD